MKFVIYEDAWIQGVFHPCPKGTHAIISLPSTQPGPVAVDGVAGPDEPFSHISLAWDPLDEEARDAQIRVHEPKLSPDGVLEFHAHGREGTGVRVGYDPKTKGVVKWAGKRILGKVRPNIDAKGKETPVPVHEHESVLAPVGQVVLESKSGEVDSDGEAVDAATAARNLADRKAFVQFQKERRDAEAKAERDAAAAAEAAKAGQGVKPAAGQVSADNPLGA